MSGKKNRILTNNLINTASNNNHNSSNNSKFYPRKEEDPLNIILDNQNHYQILVDWGNSLKIILNLCY